MAVPSEPDTFAADARPPPFPQLFADMVLKLIFAPLRRLLLESLTIAVRVIAPEADEVEALDGRLDALEISFTDAAFGPVTTVPIPVVVPLPPPVNDGLAPPPPQLARTTAIKTVLEILITPSLRIDSPHCDALHRLSADLHELDSNL